MVRQLGGHALPQHGRPVGPDGSRDPQRPTHLGPPPPLPGWEQCPLGSRRWAGGEGDPATSEPGVEVWAEEACGQDEDGVSRGRWVWRRLPG